MWGNIKIDVNGTVFEDLDLDRVQWWVHVKTRIGAGLTLFGPNAIVKFGVLPMRNPELTVQVEQCKNLRTKCTFLA
jgi:hypothetical protein